jgi:uncharacterized membrane protein
MDNEKTNIHNLTDFLQNINNCTPERFFRSQTTTRIVVKAVVYHILSFFISFSITFIITKSYFKSFKIGLFIEVVNMFIYFIYENLWEDIKWGIHETLVE